MSLFKTLLCFLLALFISAFIVASVTLLLNTSSQEIPPFSLEWGLMFSLGMFHKFGLVAVCLALCFYFLPKHFPRLLLSIAIAFPLGIAYNVVLLEWVENSLLSSLSMAKGAIMNYLLYYGAVAMVLALIGGLLCKYIEKHS